MRTSTASERAAADNVDAHERITVEVALGLPSRQALVSVEIEAGACVAQAVAASGLLERFPEVDRSDLAYAVFGARVRADAQVHAGDRVEILRALEVDPKEARRLRVRKRGAKPPAR